MQAPAEHTSALPKHIFVGYWHNWHASPAAFLPLREVVDHFDVINIAFATLSEAGRVSFALHPAQSLEEFQSDVAYLQSLGKKVVLSIGGATGSTAIDNRAARDNFCSSAVDIVRRYGFDGIDVNLEGKVLLDRGDTDFRNPGSPSIRYLVAAIREVRNQFGPDFILSLAPETVNVQGGFQAYEGCSGSYLPVIHQLRDILTYLQVQHYNSEPLAGLDHNTYSPGTADFQVAMTEMLLEGFPVEGKPDQIFPPLKPEQVVIGLAACPNAVNGGYTAPIEARRALNYLARAESFEGACRLQDTASYPALRGIMTWSINWDAVERHQFSDAIRSCLDALP